MAQLITIESLAVCPNGELLKDLRTNQKKETQRDVEYATGIVSPRLCLYESGKPISLGHLKILAKHYGVSVVALTHPNDADRVRAIIRDLQVLYPTKNGNE